MKSYLRFLSRNKLYTAIMAVGLSLALAFVILIGNYVWTQYAVAHEHKDADRIYTIGLNTLYSNIGLTLDDVKKLRERIPEIEASCQYISRKDKVVILDGKQTYAKTIAVDTDFFDMFRYLFINGSNDVLDDKSNVIVSERFANNNGGADGIIGKSIGIAGENFRVAAVMEDFHNSIFPYCDVVISTDSKINELQRNYRYGADAIPFILLKEGASASDVGQKIEKEYRNIIPEDHFIFNLALSEMTFIMSYSDVFFSDKGRGFNKADMKTLRIMLAIVVLILLSAAINYINLSTAMSGKRLKETAARMVSGAERGRIFRKYIIESVFMCLTCTAAAVVIATAFEPYMNRLLESDVPMNVSLSPGACCIYILMAIAIGTASGLLPASVGISVKPVDVFKGRFRAENKMIFSKVFIAFQSIISIVLTAAALSMELQMRHMVQRPAGADISDKYFIMLDDIRERGPLVEDIRKMPFVTRIGISDGYPGGMNEFGRQQKDGTMRFGVMVCDSTAFRMFGFGIKENKGYPLANSIWMPQSTFDALELNPAAPEKSWDIIGTDEQTVFGGILEDYAIKDALQADPDASYIHVKDSEGIRNFFSYSAGLVIETTGDHTENAKALEDAYRRFIESRSELYFPPIKSGYIEDLVVAQLQTVRNRMRITEIFMLLSLLLSFMGLVAMSTYYAAENTGDIAIRKIYGSTVRNETAGSIWRYMKIVLISCIIAVPIAVYTCGRYLESFVYRIENRWWVYAFAVLVALAISLLAVFLQTLRAARTNPADALKKE